MALVSAAPITAAQEFVDGTFKKLVQYMRDEEGLTLQEAKDVVGNILADLALNATIIGGVLKTKIAIKTAEYFGFTAKGVAKKTLTGKAATVAKKYAGPLDKFKAMSLVNKIITAGGLFGGLTWIGVGIANVIEPGIYKPREANDVWERFTGVRPFPEKAVALSPGNMDASRFNDLARSLEVGGIKGFNDPVNRQSRLYSREDLAAIIDYAYGKALLDGKTIKDYRDILPLIRPYLIGGTTTPQPSSTQAITSPAPQVAPQVKVFTGVVSQGVVGAGLSFTPRPDDLIESAAELQQAISNNVSSYLAALPSRVTYEIKVVSSVIVNGIRRTGTSQRIVSGTYKNGTPKYKNVTNKFAVADLFLITDRGTRSKLTSIILGPTDALNFQPSSNELFEIAQVTPQNVVTSNPDEVTTIVSSTPTETISEAVQRRRERIPDSMLRYFQDGWAGQGSLVDYLQEFHDKIQQRFNREGTTVPFQEEFGLNNQQYAFVVGNLGGIDMENRIKGNKNVKNDLISYIEGDNLQAMETIRTEQRQGAVESPPEGGSSQTTTPASSIATPATSLPSAALTATTLFSYYAALGQQLPSLTERGQLYQSLGLGQSTFYTGTAEQNTRLLNALKGK